MPSRDSVRGDIDDAIAFHDKVFRGVRHVVSELKPEILTIGGAGVGALVAPRVMRKLLRKSKRAVVPATIGGALAGGAIGQAAGARSPRRKK